jgi:hypothetical protein
MLTDKGAKRSLSYVPLMLFPLPHRNPTPTPREIPQSQAWQAVRHSGATFHQNTPRISHPINRAVSTNREYVRYQPTLGGV